jgi:hypothetical protein
MPISKSFVAAAWDRLTEEATRLDQERGSLDYNNPALWHLWVFHVGKLTVRFLSPDSVCLLMA